jgi:hypothetical protein
MKFQNAAQNVVEEIQVLGSNLVEKVKSLIHEGNVQKVIIKTVQGDTLIEIPVTFAAIGIIAAPIVAAVGAIAAMVAKCTLVIERKEFVQESESAEAEAAAEPVIEPEVETVPPAV